MTYADQNSGFLGVVGWGLGVWFWLGVVPPAPPDKQKKSLANMVIRQSAVFSPKKQDAHAQTQTPRQAVHVVCH
ncbi:hypothetical protein AAGG49_21915, partial [Stenotrophomonas maltophilia]|uniref:hypothetical protein n=1 Tax=Stenotrophomonas maltophilia TaxID=40324 RepID=UPI00313CF35A